MQKGKRADSLSKHRIYVDTNIFQGALSGRSTPDIVFINSAKEEKCEYYTSIYALMELLDVAKDRQFLMKCVIEKWTDVATFQKKRKSKDLSKEDLSDLAKLLNNFFLTNNKIKFINIKDSDWSLVKEIAETSNLHSSDVLHLVTAWVGNCQVLVTNDSDFVTEGNKILKRENVYDSLRVCHIADVEAILKEIKLPRKITLKVKVND